MRLKAASIRLRRVAGFAGLGAAIILNIAATAILAVVLVLAATGLVAVQIAIFEWLSPFRDALVAVWAVAEMFILILAAQRCEEIRELRRLQQLVSWR